PPITKNNDPVIIVRTAVLITTCVPHRSDVRQACSSLQYIEICCYIGGLLFRDTEVRHRRSGLNLLWFSYPTEQVFRCIYKRPGDVITISEALKGRADCALGLSYSRDSMT